MKEELLKGLTNEQINRVKSCKSNNELLSLAKQEGIELSNEQLEDVSGGGCGTTWVRKCPKCGSTEFDSKIIKSSMVGDCGTGYKCRKCHHYWTEK